MKKVIKIFIGILSITLLLIGGFIAGAYVQTEKYKQLNSSSVDIDTIAIVNMDSGVEVDGENINYASQLMNIDNSIYTVKGLSDAKQGIKNNTYAAYIIIPDKFSEGIQTFYDNPEKINLQYHYNEMLDVEARVKAAENVNAFINELNTNVAYMYVATVLDEYHRVQDYTDALLANDSKELNNLNDIQAQDLIAYVEAADTVSVDSSVPAIELSPYTSRNDALLGELEAGYNKAIEDGNEAYKDIKDQSELCKNASDDIYNKFNAAVSTAKINEESIVNAGEKKVMSTIGSYNDKVNKNLKPIQEKYNIMFAKQVESNNTEANNKIDSLYSEYFNTVNDLNNNQENWNSAYDALNAGWANYYDENMLIMNQNIIDYNNYFLSQALGYLMNYAYDQAYKNAMKDAAKAWSEIYESGTSSNHTPDSTPDTASGTDASEGNKTNNDNNTHEQALYMKYWIETRGADIGFNLPKKQDVFDVSIVPDAINKYNEEHQSNPKEKIYVNLPNIISTDVNSMDPQTRAFVNGVLGFEEMNKPFSPNGDSNKPNYNQNTIDDKTTNNNTTNENADKKQAVDKSAYSVKLQRIDSNSEEAVNKSVEEFVAKFNLEDDYNKVKSVLNTEVIKKLEAESKKQISTLDKPIADFKTELGKYIRLSEAHNPYNYIDAANLSSFINDISSNTSDMESAVYKNNTDYMKYAMDVCDAANQNSENYKKSVDAAYDKTKNDVTDCIDELKQSRVDTNKNNVDMINSFSETLNYTRIGSQANTKAYDCIINPVDSAEIDKVRITKEEVSAKYLKDMAIVASAIAVLLCILIILGMLMKEKTVEAEVFDEE